MACFSPIFEIERREIGYSDPFWLLSCASRRRSPARTLFEARTPTPLQEARTIFLDASTRWILIDRSWERTELVDFPQSDLAPRPPSSQCPAQSLVSNLSNSSPWTRPETLQAGMVRPHEARQRRSGRWMTLETPIGSFRLLVGLPRRRLICVVRDPTRRRLIASVGICPDVERHTAWIAVQLMVSTLPGSRCGFSAFWRFV